LTDDKFKRGYFMSKVKTYTIKTIKNKGVLKIYG